MRAFLMTPKLDTRAGRVVASRIGLRAVARAFTQDEDLLGIVRAALAGGVRIDCVLVDEAQFLRKAQVWQLTDVADALGIPVLAYGLRTDFRGELLRGASICWRGRTIWWS